MKKIEYKGSLTKDLKFTRESYNLFTFFIKEKNEKWLILLTVILMMTSFAMTSLNFFSVIVCYYPTIWMFYKRFKEARSIFDKEKKEVKNKMDEMGTNILDDENMSETLENALVLETVDIKREMDRYIEHITSDIYYINREDKIAALKQVEEYFKYNNGKLSVRTTKLYKLENDEITNNKTIPVKQVLKLRNETK